MKYKIKKMHLPEKIKFIIYEQNKSKILFINIDYKKRATAGTVTQNLKNTKV